LLKFIGHYAGIAMRNGYQNYQKIGKQEGVRDLSDFEVEE
jgi:hypothetical protein